MLTTHHHLGQSFAVVYFPPHQDGFCIFETDGTYQDRGGKMQTVFRHGEVFARHGTSSKRWKQSDVAVIKRQLQAGADRVRDDAGEALQLLQALPRQLGGSGLWLAMVVMPEYLAGDPPMLTTYQARQFLQDWQLATAPIEAFNLGGAMYRQPGALIMTSQATVAEDPHWWLLALHDAGLAVGAQVLAHEVAADPVNGEKKWYGLPPRITAKPTIPARRDELEIRLLTLLDVLTAYASNVKAGGRALVMAALLALRDEPGISIALLDEVVDENGNTQGWRLAGARANLPLADVVMQPVTRRVRLAEMRDPAARVRAAHRLAADLLGIFGIDQPGVLIAEGTLDPAGTGTDHDQMVYQHAQHLGLRLPSISPAERRQRLEAAIRAAQDEYRHR